jgi:hypothetical protein
MTFGAEPLVVTFVLTITRVLLILPISLLSRFSGCAYFEMSMNPPAVLSEVRS